MNTFKYKNILFNTVDNKTTLLIIFNIKKRKLLKPRGATDRIAFMLFNCRLSSFTNDLNATSQGGKGLTGPKRQKHSKVIRMDDLEVGNYTDPLTVFTGPTLGFITGGTKQIRAVPFQPLFYNP